MSVVGPAGHRTVLLSRVLHWTNRLSYNYGAVVFAENEQFIFKLE